jgi:hypothetical protein
VPFCARQLSAASGVLTRRSVLQLGAQIGSYGALQRLLQVTRRQYGEPRRA